MIPNGFPVTRADLAIAETPSHIFLPRGMLIPEEQKLLYLLARNHYSGAGEIIDAGAFCGASAYAFAAGLSDNSQVTAKSKRINSYDLFCCNESYTRNFVQNVFYSQFDEMGSMKRKAREVKVGESFFDVFLFQTQRYAANINTHQGSFLEFHWDGRPVEILFVDVAKTLDLQRHAFSEYLDCLMPGRTILIQQDFHHVWHPYIHVAMEYLRPWFDVLISAVGGTRAYILREKVTKEAADKVKRFAFSEAETLELIERTITLAPDGERPLLMVVLARQAYVIGDMQRCAEIVKSIRERYSANAYLNTLVGQACPGIGAHNL